LKALDKSSTSKRTHLSKGTCPVNLVVPSLLVHHGLLLTLKILADHFCSLASHLSGNSATYMPWIKSCLITKHPHIVLGSLTRRITFITKHRILTVMRSKGQLWSFRRRQVISLHRWNKESITNFNRKSISRKTTHHQSLHLIQIDRFYLNKM